MKSPVPRARRTAAVRVAARRRRFGQHFLSDAATVQRIVAHLAPSPADLCLEIGAGRGALTEQLSGRIAALLAIEIDPRLVRQLRARLAGVPGFTVIEADVLRIEPQAIADRLHRMQPASGRVRVFGSLPYRVATTVLRRLLPRADLFTDFTVVVQKEVGQRILAGPGSSAYGYLSVFVGLHAAARSLLAIGPAAFTPRPSVDSLLLRLEPAAPPALTPELRSGALDLASRSFRHRRKTLVNSLQASGLRQDRLIAAIRSVDLPASCRPQDLGPSDYVRLAAALASRADLPEIA